MTKRQSKILQELRDSVQHQSQILALESLENPQDIPFLSGLIQREIIYRVLRGRAGARLRGVATLGDQSHRTAKAISWIAANYAKPLRVEELAQVASMGVSTLHHHFRMLTAMSPLQYQNNCGFNQRVA